MPIQYNRLPTHWLRTEGRERRDEMRELASRFQLVYHPVYGVSENISCLPQTDGHRWEVVVLGTQPGRG